MENKPVLSIGMIFKDEIRCLERCLESLRPLREAVPCELVMADTGSGDGSREVAERYADVLFDFPWTGDFSAARNAVLERCRGEWHLQIDADEWLEGDGAELAGFLKTFQKIEDQRSVTLKGISLIIRNYTNTGYTDSRYPRLFRLSLGMRYTGRIHENVALNRHKGKVAALDHTLLHHDGYVGLFDTEAGGRKLQRNLELLRAELKERPEDLNRLLQYIESAQNEPDVWDVCRKACALVGEKRENWRVVGPAIFRHAVFFARRRKLPELEERIDQAEAWFPDSAFTKLDVGYSAFTYSREKGDHKEAVRRGEQWLRDAAEFHAGGGDQAAAEISTLAAAENRYVPDVQLLLADSCLREGQSVRAWELLEGLDCRTISGGQARLFLTLLLRFQSETERDTTSMMLRLWEQSGNQEVRDGILSAAAQAFETAHLREETGLRRGYTLFLPLADRCDLGRAAAVLASRSVPETEGLLARVEDWTALPPLALAEALLSGVCFPLAERPLKLEEMDALASGLARTPETLREILNKAAGKDYAGRWQTLAWVRALALAAVQVFPWEDVNGEGVALARLFAKVEGAFLTGCYTPEVLREENLLALPPMHRFGWYCAQAFNALEAGDSAGYTRLLRAGLETNHAMKPMVEYLAEHTPELGDAGTSPELLALAEKVRAMLAAYPADDPAVQAIKESPVYQRVAYLIGEN